MKKSYSKIIVFLLSSLVIFSCKDDDAIQSLEEHQNPSIKSERIRTCGHEHHMNELMSNPDYKILHEAKFTRLRTASKISQLAADCTAPTVIPVAVHFQDASSNDMACLTDLAKNSIDALNKDYQGSNADITKWNNTASSNFPGVANGEACVTFCIADQNHPGGFGLSNGQLAVTVNQTQGDNDNRWSGYLNIYVIPNTGFLGYAPLGGSGNGDGVVIDAGAFGLGGNCGNVGASSPYDLGRTLTHEVGHYMLLDHIWGNGCNTDDDVADTPDQNSDYGGCPNIGEQSCGSTDMHMNYMDYTNDACMYMFSAGQSSRMVGYISSSLNNLVQNASNVCSGNDGGNPPDDPTDDPTDEPTACDAPTDSNVEQVTENTATISWTSVASATRYRIRTRSSGSNWSAFNVTEPLATIEGLTPSTAYEYQIRTDCGDGWTSWTSIQSFNTADEEVTEDPTDDTACEAVEVNFKLVLDDYGSETSWVLKDEFNVRVTRGGPYEDGVSGTEIEESFCLEDGCYRIIVRDSYGDGICCDYGEGSFELTDKDGNQIIYSDGFFGRRDVWWFCVESGIINNLNREVDQKPKTLAKKVK